VALVTPSTAARAPVEVASVTVLALSTLSANGSGWTKRLRTHSVFVGAAVAFVALARTVVLLAVAFLAGAAGVAVAAGRDGDG
jgi:hypothetical protein